MRRALLRRDGRRAALERRVQRVPAQARALHARRELAHARERGELAERRIGRPRPAASAGRAPCRTARAIAARSLPLTASVISEAEAVEMAQPLPSKRMSSTALAVQAHEHACSRSPHSGLCPSACASRRVELAEIARAAGCDRGSRRGRDPSGPSAEHLARLARAPRPARRRPPRCCSSANEARAVAGTPKNVHHRHGAVVAGAHRDALGVEDRAEVVRVHALMRERQHRGLVGARCR